MEAEKEREWILFLLYIRISYPHLLHTSIFFFTPYRTRGKKIIYNRIKERRG
jgi:hypothetical protein